MKNILAENLLRFGVKNLNESDKKVLSEALLLEQTQQVATAMNTLNDALKLKPTIVGGASVYPIVNINWTTAGTPKNGGDATEICKELPFTDSKWDAKNLPEGSKMPKTISISIGVDNLDKTNEVYKKFLKDKKLYWKRTYKFAYNRSENLKGDIDDSWLAMTLKPATKQLVDAIKIFYYVDTATNSWWGTPGVNAIPSGNSDDFTDQFDSLCRLLTGYPYNPIVAF